MFGILRVEFEDGQFKRKFVRIKGKLLTFYTEDPAHELAGDMSSFARHQNVAVAYRARKITEEYK